MVNKMKIIRSKKAMYNWFVLTFAIVLFITAFFSLLSQKNSVDFNTVGQRSDFIYEQMSLEDLNQLKLEECAKRASNKAIIELTLNGGRRLNNLLDGYKGFVPYEKDTVYNSDSIENYFIGLFYKNLIEELKESGVNFVINSKSIDVVNGNNVYGFGDRVKREYDIETYGSLNITYIPSFSYKFQNYNLSDYDKIYNIMNNFVIKSMRECNKEGSRLTGCVATKLDKQPVSVFNQDFKGLKMYFDKDCVNKFDKNYFVEYRAQYNQLLSAVNTDDKHHFVCIVDNNKFISGKKESNGKEQFMVDNPMYFFIINKEELKEELNIENTPIIDNNINGINYQIPDIAVAIN